MNESALALLGLTEYEGKVYRALLAEHPATAYRLGKRSGVPLSRVYEIASRLVEKGAATAIPGEPAQYAPVPPEVLIQGARLQADRQFAALSVEMSALFANAGADGHGWIRGEHAVLKRVGSLVAVARSEVLLAAAPAARDRLEDSLQSVSRGLHLKALPLSASARGDAGFVLLVDGDAALIGRLGPAADGLSSNHPVLARLCSEYFRLRTIADAVQESLSISRSVRPGLFEEAAGWLDWEEEKQRRLLQAH